MTTSLSRRSPSPRSRRSGIRTTRPVHGHCTSNEHEGHCERRCKDENGAGWYASNIGTHYAGEIRTSREQARMVVDTFNNTERLTASDCHHGIILSGLRKAGEPTPRLQRLSRVAPAAPAPGNAHALTITAPEPLPRLCTHGRSTTGPKRHLPAQPSARPPLSAASPRIPCLGVALPDDPIHRLVSDLRKPLALLHALGRPARDRLVLRHRVDRP